MAIELPVINWFELEVLTSLSETPKYGQQVLLELRHRLSGNVSSGRVYPVLQKLEKLGHIKKNEPENGKFFYTITDSGQEEISKANEWSLRSLLKALVSELIEDVSRQLRDQVDEVISDAKGKGEEIHRFAVIRFPESRLYRPKKHDLVTHLSVEPYNMDVFLIDIPHANNENADISPDIYPEPPRPQNVMELTGKFEDIPLKNDYLDIIFLSATLVQAPDRDAHMKEVLRTLKPGGRVFVSVASIFDSYILESLTEILNRSKDESVRTGPGMKRDEIEKLLNRHLEDVRIERVKEMILCSGRKS